MKVYLLILSATILLIFSACNRNQAEEIDNNAEPYTTDVPPPPPVPQYETQNEDDTTLPSADTNIPTRYIPTYGVLHQPIDLGGRTLRVLTTRTTIPFSGGGEEPDPATADNYRIARMIWDNAERVRHSFNFEVEDVMRRHTPAGVLQYLTTSVLAGDPLGDIAFMFAHNKLPAIMGDIILPLDSVDLLNSDILGSQVFGQVEAELIGERWSFSPNAPEFLYVMLGVNLDVLAAIGAPNPVDLYHRGQWTWDAWLDIMRLASQHTAAGGDTSLYGIAGPPFHLFSSLIAANDGQIVSDDFQWGVGSPNAIEALEFAADIMGEGLWHHNPVIQHIADGTRGRQTFRDGNSAFFIFYDPVLWDGAIPFDFTLVPFPPGPGNTTGNIAVAAWEDGLVLPHGSSWDPAEILMVVEEFWTWPGSEHELMLESNLNWVRDMLPTEEDFQRALGVTRRTNFCITLVKWDLINVYGNFTNYFLWGEMTAAQAIETHRASQQEILDNFFR